MSTTVKIIIAILVTLSLLLAGLIYLKLSAKPAETSLPAALTYSNNAVDVSVTYPVIAGSSTQAKNATLAIQADIKNKVDRFALDVKDDAAIGTDLPREVKSTVTGSPSIEEQNDRYISIYMGMEWYMRGAAHPFHTIDTYIYDYETGKLVTSPELFTGEYLPVLASLSKEDLINQSKEGDLGFTIDEQMLDEGTQPLAENFSNILPLKDGIVIFFDEYQVAPYAAGPQQVVIPYSKLQLIINPASVLGIYLK
jgi:hypothetical protein